MAVWDPLGGGQTHFDVVLTQISVDWPNEGFVGGVLFPEVGVTRISDKYYIFGREAWGLPPEGDLRSPGAVANEVPGRALSTDTYYAQEHALQIAVPDEERENTDSVLAPDRDAVELITAHILLGREVAIHTLVTTAANYASSHTVTLAGGDQWSAPSTSDPIGDVKAGRVAMHASLKLLPNLGIIPWEVMVHLEDHPQFIERIKYTQVGQTTEGLIAALLRIPRIVVPGLGYNSANPGQAESIGYLWGKDVLLAYVPARAGRRIPAFGYEFNWRIGGRTQVIERWREGQRVSDLHRIRRRYDLKLVAKDASDDAIGGYLIKDAVA